MGLPVSSFAAALNRELVEKNEARIWTDGVVCVRDTRVRAVRLAGARRSTAEANPRIPPGVLPSASAPVRRHCWHIENVVVVTAAVVRERDAMVGWESRSSVALSRAEVRPMTASAPLSLREMFPNPPP